MAVFIKMTPLVDAGGRGQWFGAEAIQELLLGWPWPHEYVSLAQITHLEASTTTHIYSKKYVQLFKHRQKQHIAQ